MITRWGVKRKQHLQTIPLRFYDGGANKTYQINAKETEDAMKFRDSVIFYLLENDEVIIL